MMNLMNGDHTFHRCVCEGEGGREGGHIPWSRPLEGEREVGDCCPESLEISDKKVKSSKQLRTIASHFPLANSRKGLGLWRRLEWTCVAFWFGWFAPNLMPHSPLCSASHPDMACKAGSSSVLDSNSQLGSRLLRMQLRTLQDPRRRGSMKWCSSKQLWWEI